MFALNRILVPTNLGEPSQTAIQYGIAFARQFGAKLYLLHVLDAKDLDAAIETERVLETLSPDENERATPEPSPLDVARNAARQELGRLLDPQEEQDTRAEYLLRALRHGGAGRGDRRLRARAEVELIVMGKHNLGFVEHLLAGSVAEKVIRHAPCPVLIVQHPEHDFVLADSPQHTLAQQ